MKPFEQVIICEKPKQAKIFQKVLKLSKKYDVGKSTYAWYDKEGGICVFYERGHILELLPPQHYQPELNKGWTVDLLPVIVKGSRWPLRVNTQSSGSSQMFKTAKWALKDCGTPNEIVIATDNDREGELLGWELLEHLKLANHPNITRALYSQVTEKKVLEAYNKRQDGMLTFARYLAGLARQYADWSVGMNVTMGMSAKNQKNIPLYHALNSGRVIFAICYILYHRYCAMRDFRPQDFFTHSVNFVANGKDKYSGNLVVPIKYCDPDLKKVTNEDLANKIKAAITKGKKGIVVRYDKENKSTPPPLGFHRTGFDRHMIKKHGMSLEQVAKGMQTLYEAGYITYPRVDLKVIDETMHPEMPSYIEAIKKNISSAPQLSEKEKAIYKKVFQLVSLDRKTKIFKKGVDEGGSHHAIITTEESVPMGKLSNDEFKIYRELADRLLLQFLPLYEYASTIVETKVAGGLICSTKGTSPIRMGWKGLNVDAEDQKDDDEVDGGILPELKLGDEVAVNAVIMKQQTTVCPKHLSDADLLSALENPRPYVENKELLKTLKNIKIGTDGTRQNHVASLGPKGFVEFKKEGKTKVLVPLKKLTSIMEVAPTYLSTPETTGYWESMFDEIEAGKITLEVFIAKFRKLEARFFTDLKAGKFDLKEPIIDGFKICSEKTSGDQECGGNLFPSVTKKKHKIWRCSSCRSSYFDDKGNVGKKIGDNKGGADWTPPPNAAKIKCPECDDGYTYHRKREGASWSYWTCTGCKASFFDSKGAHGKKMGAKK
jgi:DNA topoisomerase-3